MAKRKGARVKRRGNSYVAHWRDPITDERKNRVVGYVRDLGEHLDEATELRLLASVQDGIDAASVGGPTLAQFLDAYEGAYRMKVRPYTFESTYSQMRKLAIRLGSKPMNAVDVPFAESFLAGLRFAGLSGQPNCVNSMLLHYRRLKHFWGAAQKRGIVDGNPWKDCEVPRVQRRAIHAITEEQVPRLLAATPPDQRSLVRLLLDTGLRLGEVSRLRWVDVHPAPENPERIHVTESKSRTGYVKLTPEARGALLDQLHGQDMVRGAAVFPKIQTKSHQTYQRRRWQDAIQLRGFPKLRLHDCRHSLGFRLAKLGYSQLQVSKVLRITPAMAELYMDHNPQGMADQSIDGLTAARKKAQERAAGTG